MSENYWKLVYLCKECNKIQEFITIHDYICLNCGSRKSFKPVSGKWVSTANIIDKFLLRNVGLWEYREHE